MIVCAKCGFTQPRDVYCANCGINLEKYKPEKPPKWIQLLKDPYFQISSAIIAAVAAFFITINKPALDELDLEASMDEKSPISEISEIENTNAETMIAKKETLIVSKKTTLIKNLSTPAKTTEVSALKKLQKEFGAKPLPADAVAKDVALPPLNVDYSFYEVQPNQFEKYFTSTAKVQASVVSSSDIKNILTNLNKLPMDKTWTLSADKTTSLDYMLENFESGEKQGVKFTVNTSSPETSALKSITIQVNAVIPSKEGSGISIDWSRSLPVKKGQTILIKIKLPDQELATTFLDENYNSPLSIMSSPQYQELKTQLLGVVTFN